MKEPTKISTSLKSSFLFHFFMIINLCYHAVRAIGICKEIIRGYVGQWCIYTAPPVSKCLTSECKGAALSKPHPPNTVTIFTVSGGPLPALKCNLRCSKCGTIYNYSMYGNKKKGGERYYEVFM